MDKSDELHHLQQRKKELDCIVCNLEDIRIWFSKNQNDMVSDLFDFDEQLGDAIDNVQDVSWNLEYQAEELEEEMESEKDD